MKLACILPFTHLEVADAGRVLCCCWGRYKSLGDLRNKTINQIWNSKEFQVLREKIYQRKLEDVCDEKICHVLLSGRKWTEGDLKRAKLPSKLIEEIKNKKTKLSTGPLRITLSDIGTCNLRCKMCYRYFVSEDKNFSQSLIKKELPEFLNQNPRQNLVIKLTGNGEVFFRRETREFLQNLDSQKYPNVCLEILTNGLLLTPKMWRTISHNKIREINVSVDAASKSTYEKIRRGGNWDKLLKNLEFIGKLRKSNKINYFYINMVVMKSNYQEMKDFVFLGKKLGCDEVNFQRITGLHNLEENINDFPDPKIIQEIAKSLRDPIFKGTEKFKINTLELQDYLTYQPRSFERLRTKVKIWCYKGKINLKKLLKKFL